jgi:hypothetical protein
MFFLSSVLGIMRSREKTATYDLLTAVGIGILLILWIMETGFQDWQGLLLSGWAVVFVCGAFLLFRYTGKQEPLFVYAGVSAGMIAAALSAELDGATLSIALVSEISLIPVLSYFVLRDISVAIKASWLHVITAIIAFASVQSYPWYGAKVLNEDFFVLLLSGVFMIATGAYLYFEMKRTSASSTMKNVVPALCSYGSVVLYTLIWLSFGIAYPDDPIAIMLSLLIYSLSGLVFYFIGTIRQKRGLRIYGSFVLGFVVARVLLVDVWSMELSMRIVTFFLLGALFISTAFWGKRVGTISHS